MAMFGIVAISLILYFTFWHLPLLSLDELKTSTQDGNFSDQNFYLYVATELCKSSEWHSDEMSVTWSATGIIGYLTYGCEVFGTEYFYIILNPLLVVLGLGVVVRAARQLGFTPHITVATLLSIPYTLLTLSLPGKEAISVVGTLFSVAGLMLVTKSEFRLRGIFYIIFGLGIVALNRLHEAGALLVFIILWGSGLIRSPWRMIMLLIICSYIADDLLGFALESQGATSITDKVLWSGSSEGKSFNLDGVFDLLRSDNLFLHSILGLFRVLAVLVSPLSSLFTPFAESDPAYFIFRDLAQRLRIIDWFLIVFTLNRFVRSKNVDKKLLKHKLLSMLPMLFLFMIYVISFFGVTQKSRYIFQYTPLLLLWLWLFEQSHVKAKKWNHATTTSSQEAK
jgi:hypothetical protein